MITVTGNITKQDIESILDNIKSKITELINQILKMEYI